MPVRLLSDLKTRGKFEERPFQTPVGTLVHATTQESLPKIMKDGLKPRGETFCEVWGEERIAYWIREIEEAEKREKALKEVKQCRRKSVYFWDDYQEGVQQALATVGYLKKGEPALLVVDAKSLKPKIDPEYQLQEEETEAVAYVVRGDVDRERIECVCELKEGMVPTSTGAVMCQGIHKKEECPEVKYEELFETLSDISNWECDCKE